MKLLLKNARLLDMVGMFPEIKERDILIDGNKIAEISQVINESADKIIDCDKNIVMPGFSNEYI